MNSVIQKISYQIRPYPTIQKKTGKHAFGLQIVIDGDPRMLPIEIYWYKDQFDFKSELFLISDIEPDRVRDLNFSIAKEKSRANDILMRYRLTDRLITHKQFKWEFTNYASRENVHEWLESRADKMLSDGEIKLPTRTTYTTKFARFKSFYPGPLPISDINSVLITKFNNYLRSNYAYNTVIGTHKTFRKFLTLAGKEGLIPESPYTSTKINNSYIEGERESLEPYELIQLINLFKEKERLTETQLNVLEMFVFAATSGGYRFSELQILHSKHIKFGVLRLDTVKGENSGVSLRVDLPDIGKKIIEGRKGLIFRTVSEQTANKTLKVLTSMAGINKHITFHSARDTFGTFYVYYGGDITVLSKDILKHSKLETTMIYQKKSSEMKRKDMQNFNRFSLPTFGSHNDVINDTEEKL
ncbi:tyrosine-type recombinase/integrase [Pedobacter vanadiisoli]|uniref:Tyrosine-type recombinase/integrase n=1 Tax=Pedobacter vanadiisoli TaxID=1761975 RepID=A0ABW5MGA7_9SPHI